MNKKLAVFCDGTWNEPDKNPTNVARLFEATLQENNGVPQIACYVQGVGTHWYDRMIGGAFGFGISQNIKEGYRFLCANYEPGDEIYLFGFSRGAYTARSLGGLIHNMGILKREHFGRIDEAYAHYKDKSPEWHPNPSKGGRAKEFREAYAHGGEKIAFLGVWDTVGALGAPYGLLAGWLADKIFGCRFHDVKLSSTIQSACHAVSTAEHRWPFRPTLWELQPVHARERFAEEWFPGVHSDVGGGYPESGLSDATLRWMAHEADARGLKSALPDSSASLVTHNSQTFYYRLLTILWLKWQASLLVDLPGKIFRNWPAWIYRKLNDLKLISEPDIAAKIARIRWNGDYLRR